eukprot:CAMPEP_0201948734 /NCGR_PEP_ID=MMETSP0903-20130614/55611_1 /ASSEMBLY_ACC=CAM_ASM_000552 /TAXON_ID=420261 /ORGANISM="Thalassiosira antarctica, Strain CCMP982" /LENGTH=1324 /DNA_ID=CAMNT_0048491929 /DNA_START=66 /DNA_END=4040 /DNA_ORIENTATION=+
MQTKHFIILALLTLLCQCHQFAFCMAISGSSNEACESEEDLDFVFCNLEDLSDEALMHICDRIGHEMEDKKASYTHDDYVHYAELCLEIEDVDVRESIEDMLESLLEEDNELDRRDVIEYIISSLVDRDPSLVDTIASLLAESEETEDSTLEEECLEKNEKDQQESHPQVDTEFIAAQIMAIPESDFNDLMGNMLGFVGSMVSIEKVERMLHGDDMYDRPDVVEYIVSAAIEDSPEMFEMFDAYPSLTPELSEAYLPSEPDYVHAAPVKLGHAVIVAIALLVCIVAVVISPKILHLYGKKKKKKGGKKRKGHKPSTESITSPLSPDHQTHSKQHTNKRRSANSTRSKRNHQKKHSKNFTKRGSPRHQESNNLSVLPSPESPPKRNENVDATATRSESKQDKMSSDSITEQRKESQMEDHTNKSSETSTPPSSEQDTNVDTCSTNASVIPQVQQMINGNAPTENAPARSAHNDIEAKATTYIPQRLTILNAPTNISSHTDNPQKSLSAPATTNSQSPSSEHDTNVDTCSTNASVIPQVQQMINGNALTENAPARSAHNDIEAKATTYIPQRLTILNAPTNISSHTDDPQKSLSAPATTNSQSPTTLEDAINSRAHYLTGSPATYTDWLRTELDIESPADLAEALDECLDMLVTGDGTVGIKKGLENAFRNAVLNIADEPASGDAMTSLPMEQEVKEGASSAASDGASNDFQNMGEEYDVNIVAYDGGRACQACTFINPKLFLHCSICGTPSPPIVIQSNEAKKDDAKGATKVEAQKIKADIEMEEKKRAKKEAKKQRAKEAKAAKLAEVARQEEEEREVADAEKQRRLEVKMEKQAAMARTLDSKVDEQHHPQQPSVQVKKQNYENERMNRLIREAREDAAVAKEKMESKKSKNHARWLKEQEVEKLKRAKSWHEKVAKENKRVELICQLIVAEFLRQDKDNASALTKEQVLQNSDASKVIANEGQKANNALFRGIRCRVKVVGFERHALNGHQGTLRYWDNEQEKFCIGLDTKKSQDSNVQFLMPENLEEMPTPRASKSGIKSMQGYSVAIKDMLNQCDECIGFRFTLERSAVGALMSAKSVDAGLEAFCHKRNKEETRKRLELEEQEEEFRKREEIRKQEEIDRKRRAARRATERAEKEQARNQWRREKEEASRAEYERRAAEMQSLRETLRRAFSHKMRLKMLFLKAACEGISPEELHDYLEEEGIDFGDFDSDDPFVSSLFDSYSDFFEEINGDYDEDIREETEEKDRKMAAILGVEPDADERTLKVTHRKLALKFHPDRWRSDSDHGMAREEAQEKFKEIQNAYDHLMSRFDDEYDENDC